MTHDTKDGALALLRDGQTVSPPIACRAADPVVSLRARPYDSAAERLRQAVSGERLDVLAQDDTWAHIRLDRDGYEGFIPLARLVGADTIRPTHVVSARQTLMHDTPRLKSPDSPLWLSFGTLVEAGPTHHPDTGESWTEVTLCRPVDPAALQKTRLDGVIPSHHLRPLSDPEPDLVAVAERFLGTPYLWGGNSGFGIDCSGLIQAALLAANLPCPGDSGPQRDALGINITDETAPRRGDLWFWKGHVGILTDPQTLLHANAHHMAVVREPVHTVAERIAASGGGPVLARKRLL